MADSIATRDAYGKKLVEMGGKYPDIVVLDADLTKSTKTAGFAEKYPDRFFNMGVAEANMISFFMVVTPDHEVLHGVSQNGRKRHF